MSILGNRVLRTEDPRFLTVGGTYVADLADPALTSAAYVTYVRSTMAHARLLRVDTSEAAEAPGVLAVFTGADVDLGPWHMMGMANAAMARPFLAVEKVRFVGEPVAAVVTERPEQGIDAAERVWADYEPLPVVVEPDDAAADEVLVFDEAGTNVALAFPTDADPSLFDGCDVVVRERIVNQRVAACPLEVRGGAAAYDDEGRIVLWASTQHVHGVRDAVCAMYDLPPERVRVVAPDVGGGFGPKIGVHPEELLLPWIAARLGRPVRWHETRTENMLAMGHGRGQIQTIEIGGTRDGKVLAYRLDILADGGAYPSMGVVLPFLTRMMASGVYDIPKVEVSSRAVVTNTNATSAYRGAGRPEATAAIERAVDLFAAEIGLDAAEVRRRNLVPPEAFPYTNATGTTYDTGEYERSLDLALEAAGYDELRAEQQRRRDADDPRLLGIGVAIYVEVTAGPSPGSEYARVVIDTDGDAIVYTGASPHGQGLHTAYAMLVADELGLPLESIRVVHGDTDLVPEGGGTMGSRSLQLGGAAVQQASVEVLARAREHVAELFEASVDDVVLDKSTGSFHVAGAPALTRSWADVAEAAAPSGGLSAVADFAASTATFPFGTHVAVVEIDGDTCVARLRRMITCDDAGRILNPMLAEGQRHGGIAQGAAQALYEEFRYDEDGNPLTSTFADYAIVSAAELPSFELVTLETPTPANPLGAKGIGESGTIGSTPAVQSAVVDALAHLGVRHVDMPCTPERIWRAIERARGTA